MPKFLIERGVPGAGSLSDDEISAISEKSNAVLDELPEVQWVHSYVTDDKLFCLYVAPDEGQVREHATRGGFPADAIRQVVRTIDPTTGGR